MLKRILVLIFGLAFLSTSASGETINVFGNGKLPPAGYVEEGAAKGFGVEITTAVLNAAGIDHKLKMVPWKRAYENGKKGGGIVFGMFYTEERAQIFDFSKPVWEETIVLVTAKGKDFTFNSMSDLKGKKVAHQMGFRGGSEFEKALNENVFISEPDNLPVSRLKKILSGRIDTAIFNPGIASVVWHASSAGMNPDDFSIINPPLAVKMKYIAIAKSLGRKDLIDKIDSALEKLKTDGTIKAILDKYSNAE